MTPMTFRKKPVDIQATQWDGTAANAKEIIDWILSAGGTARFHCLDDYCDYHVIAIDTLEGTMKASPADWIIRGFAGEFYPCKPEIFVATYDPA